MIRCNFTESEMRKGLELANKPYLCSFSYNGRSFPEGFSIGAKVFTDAMQMVEVKQITETYEDSSAVEWTLWLENKGDANSKVFASVLPLDYFVEASDHMKISFSQGPKNSLNDFQYMEQDFIDHFTIKSKGSSEALPFFNLDLGGKGYIIGIGWTGNWQLTLNRDGDRVKLQVFMPNTHFILYPGEHVRTPRIMLMPWEGEYRRAQNNLRRHLAEHHIPGENGEPTPPICCNVWGGMRAHSHIKYLKYIKEHGLRFDMYWIDAGWHGSDHETDEFQNFDIEDWAYNIGDWRFNRFVYPEGFLPVSKAAQEAGMKVLLWFSTYNCCQNLGYNRDNPEWGAPLSQEYRFGRNPETTRFSQAFLANPELYNWLFERISSIMLENGISGYREDCAPPAEEPQEDNRTGIGEMQAVEAMYRFWDDLRERIPGLIIDNCGGGGHRIDLETISRSYVLWRSDYNCGPDADPIEAQCANYGLGSWIPLIGGMSPVRPGNTYAFQSSLYGSMGFGLFHPCGYAPGRTEPIDDYPVEWHRAMIDQYQILKPILSGDFYPLTPYSTETGDMIGYQFERPDLGRGMIAGFRRQDCDLATLEMIPVLEQGEYIMTDLTTRETTRFVTNGNTSVVIKFKAKPDSCVLMYERC